MNKYENPELAILVASCDAYNDAAEHFFNLLNMFWKDCRYPIYMVNNTIVKDYGNVKVINAGNELDWSGRVKKALDEIDEEYVLFMLEDYYIGSKVDSVAFQDIIEFVMNEKIKYYRLTNTPKATGTNYKGFDHIFNIPNNLPYGINLQAAIWSKEFLYQTMGNEDCSAWQIEINHLSKIEDEYSQDIEGCLVDDRNIIDIYNGVIKGKWVPKTLEHLSNQGYDIDIGNRGILSLSNQISINVRGTCSRCIPSQYRKKCKSLLSKMGLKFTSEF